MQTYSTLTNLVWITTVSYVVSGHPFPLLPRFIADRAVEDGGVGRETLDQPNNFLAPLSDYEARSADPDQSKPVQPWTTITQDPVNGIQTTVGSRVELECKAAGSPPPEIFWFTGSGSNEKLVEYVKTSTRDLYDPDDEWKGVARINSKLVIECVTPEDAGLIYCASVSAREVKISSPTALMVNGEHGNKNCSSESEPTVTLYSPTRVSNIGSAVVLPCRASGKPMPRISWLDNNNVPLSISTNPRHRVLDNGDLLIENLVWEDMGGYTCQANIGHRQQVVGTFLYPLSPGTKVDRRTGN